MIGNLKLLLAFFFLLGSPLLADSTFEYYTTAECGNDYHTKCTITESPKGATFSIFHGFQGVSLVETGELSPIEWRDLKRRVAELGKLIKRPEEPVFNVDHFYLSEPVLQGPASEDIKAAFSSTKAGKRFLHWVSTR